MAIASRVSAAVVAVSVATAAVLTGSSAGSTAASGTSRRAAVNHHAVNIVVAISVDGLKPSAIRQLGPRGVPALYRMMREGSATLNARTLTERTVTLPNHISMVTGRRVDASAGGHGVSFNDDRGDRKSTRLNSSHANISYAVFCLKKNNLLPSAIQAHSLDL